MVFCLMALCGCKTGVHSSSSQMDLRVVFAQLPDSMRENPFGDKQGLKLTDVEMGELSEKGEVALGDTRWQSQYLDSSGRHLQVMRIGQEEGLQYDLLSLPVKGQRPWVLVVQSLSDHCCNFMRWGLYKVEKKQWTDLTASRMPVLDWGDWFDLSGFKAGRPDVMRVNRYPLQVTVESRPLRIALMPVADYVELEMPEGVANEMMEDWPGGPRVLVWQDGRFVWD